ncbi:hypothetical protein ACFWM3_20475 [Gottfriedia sp. NPDC058432]|uniref:hypothetical protein n=1 Tax=Gottfriedia sp. NPDC058432 TaxID=3346497 RepID=UPI003668052B
MKNISRMILVFGLLLILIGCSKVHPNKTSTQDDQTTVLENWIGPTDSGVTSRDLGLCGKSDIAKKLNLPGFILVNFTDEHISYRSSEEVVEYSSELMVDSGYKLGNLSLLLKKDSVDEVYVVVRNHKNQLTTVVVYKMGACS